MERWGQALARGRERRNAQHSKRFATSTVRPCVVTSQTLGQGDEFTMAPVRLPEQPPIFENAHDSAARRTAQGFDSVAWLERGGFAEALDNLDHALAIENAGDVVGNCRGGLAFANGRQVPKNGQRQLPTDGGESIPVEEQKWSATVEPAQ